MQILRRRSIEQYRSWWLCSKASTQTMTAGLRPASAEPLTSGGGSRSSLGPRVRRRIRRRSACPCMLNPSRFTGTEARRDPPHRGPGAVAGCRSVVAVVPPCRSTDQPEWHGMGWVFLYRFFLSGCEGYFFIESPALALRAGGACSLQRFPGPSVLRAPPRPLGCQKRKTKKHPQKKACRRTLKLSRGSSGPGVAPGSRVSPN